MASNYGETLTVGKPGTATYSSITSALNAIPTSGAEAPTFWKRYTIFINPGTYEEVVSCRPFVNWVGINKSSVLIIAPPSQSSSTGTIKLDDFVEIQSLTAVSRPGSTPSQWVIHANNKSNIGLRNIDVIPQDTTARSGCIKITGGSWTTILMEFVGMSYFGETGCALSISGNASAPQNSDLHLRNMFVDALKLNVVEAAAILLQDCHTSYLSNSLVRVKSPGAGVMIRRTGASGLVNALLEGTSVECVGGTHALDVGSNTTCYFRFSHADSQLVHPGGEIV
ncbi:MAG: hypothetical protein R3B70_10755 [Polyangiaceae bacterium]